MAIQTALAAGQRYTVFEGRTMFVNNSLAMFITMNPMYEYRSVLPSNLKALFRPVAMMVPDYTLIAEVSLYAAGFQSAAILATKLVSCLKVGGWARGCCTGAFGQRLHPINQHGGGRARCCMRSICSVCAKYATCCSRLGWHACILDPSGCASQAGPFWSDLVRHTSHARLPAPL